MDQAKMTITLQALQVDGTWATRNAFVTENARVISGSMSAADLDTKARRLMGQWQQTMADGRQLRVHNSANDPTPAARKRADNNAKAEVAARSLGWMTNQERHGASVEGYGVVHPNGHWAADWCSAVVFHDAMNSAQSVA